MPDFNWDYWRSLQGGPQAAPSAATVALPTERDVPGQIVQGITPGVWATIQGPHQGSGPDQAMAEYEARVASPRNDIWGQTLAEDRPENLARELFTPFQRGLQTGMAALKPAAKDPKVYKSGSDGYVFDPVKRQFDKVFSGEQKPDALTKQNAMELQREIAAEQNWFNKARVENDLTKTPLKDIEAHTDRIFSLRKQLEGFLEPKTEAQSGGVPQSWQADPSTIPVGAPKSFMIPPMPGNAPSATPGQARPVTTAAEFQALPSGATYIGRNGKTYRKP